MISLFTGYPKRTTTGVPPENATAENEPGEA